jgi:16S rRNA processing protein RimM
MSETGNIPQRIAIGRVRKPFGLKGQCYADGFGRAFGELEAPCKILWGADEKEANKAVLSEIKETPRGYICRFEGYDNVDDAEIFRGAYLFLDKNELPDLAANEYYNFELEGMTVVAVPANRPIGVVTEIQSYPTVETLSVRREDGSEILVPMNKGIVEKIDREKKCITVFESALEQLI